MSDQERVNESAPLEGRKPDGYFLLVTGTADRAGVDVEVLLDILWESRRILIGVVFGAASLAAAGSLLVRNEYDAEVLMSPVVQGGPGAANSLVGRLGGLGTLVGLDLGATAGGKEEYIATLKSDGFIRAFIEAEGLMPMLFEEKWDADRNAWFDAENVPTLDDAIERFTGRVFSVSEDRLSGLVVLRIRWYSPELAAQWANRMVEMVNDRLRTEAIRHAEESIAYLTKEADKTGVVELKQAVFRLIESQINNAMLANVQREYAFKVLDPAVPPDIKHKAAPKRSLIAVGSGFVGGVLAGFLVLWRRRRDWLLAAR